MNLLKQKFENNKTAFGPFLKITDPAVIEIAALAGFDFAIIDMEHGPIGYESAQNLVRAAQLHNMAAVIRVPENNEPQILRALDIGANAVQIPQIECRADAEKAVMATHYYPEGMRGVCRYVRAAGYSSVSRETYFDKANSEVSIIIHIEGVEGVNNLSDILEVPGIDVIFLGPYDLSQSCGVPGQTNNPLVEEKMKYAIDLARQKGKVVGTFTDNAEHAIKWKNLGVQYVSCSVDVGYLFSAFDQLVKKVNS
jgi:4-hydroxy-2-oxoheptanedioate aldolase